MTAEQKERLHAYAESMNEAVSEPRSGIFGNKKKRCMELVDITAKEIKEAGI